MKPYVCRLLTATILLLAHAATGLAADWVILESTSPDIQAGEIRPGGDVITLEADTQITLIGPDGGTMVVEGPYFGAIEAAVGRPHRSTTPQTGPVGDFPSLDPDYYE